MSAADHVNGSLQEIAGRSASTIGLAPIKPLTRDEFTTLVNLSRRAIRADTDTRRALHQQRVNIIPATFYSEVPRVEDIESSFEFRVPDGPYNAPEVFNPGVMAEFLAAIDHYADEFDPPTQGDRDAPNGYFWDNPAFSYSDAMAYYCVLRHLRPAQVMEIGSGFSSLIALQALERNGTGQLCCVEPNPMPWLVGLGDRIELIRVPVQSIDPLIFNARLHDGDVLFIDSTHTVKAGSDCLHIYLRVVPALTANLTIHAHDIYLPFPLPRGHFDRHAYWTEQYLLYAYLLHNPNAQVVYGSVYNQRHHRAELERLMRGRHQSGGASLWWRHTRQSTA